MRLQTTDFFSVVKLNETTVILFPARKASIFKTLIVLSLRLSILVN